MTHSQSESARSAVENPIQEQNPSSLHPDAIEHGNFGTADEYRKTTLHGKRKKSMNDQKPEPKPATSENLKASAELRSTDWLGGRMSEEMLKRYEADPLGMDAEVRQCFKVPENRYYSVSMYPPAVAGRVTVTTERVVKAHKISKSDAS